MIEPADAMLSQAIRVRLDERFDDWGREYLTPHRIGSDRNILQTLIEHRGFIPSVRMVPSMDRTLADEVEDIVLSMERVGWWLHAAILRLEYWRPALAMEAKLEQLRVEFGITVSRAGYYAKLAEAKLFVAGALFG